MRKRRDRLVAEAEAAPKTRAELKGQRQQWKDAKRKQISNMSEERRRKMNEARRVRYFQKKCGQPQHIPTSPRRYAKFVRQLITTASPTRKKELDKQGMCVMTFCSVICCLLPYY